MADPDNEPKNKHTKSKYLSVRKALKELKVNEEELKKMVSRGDIQPVYEENQVKFDEEQIAQIKKANPQLAAAPAEGDNEAVIEDEDIYAGTDNYESLFLSGSVSVHLGKTLLEQMKKEGAALQAPENNQPTPDSPAAIVASDSPAAIVASDSPIPTTRVPAASVPKSAEVTVPKPAKADTRSFSPAPEQKLMEQRERDNAARQGVEPTKRQKNVISDGPPLSHNLNGNRGIKHLFVKMSGLMEHLPLSNKGTLAVAVLGIVAGIWLVGLFYPQSNTFTQPVVQIMPLKLADFQPQLILEARVMPHRTVSVYSQVNGYITKRYHWEGEQIQEGEPILELENPALLSQLHIAAQNLRDTQLKLEETRANVQQLRKKISPRDTEMLQELEKRRSVLENQILEKWKALSAESIPAVGKEEQQSADKIDEREFLGSKLDQYQAPLDQIIHNMVEQMSSSQFQLYLAELRQRLSLHELLAAKRDFLKHIQQMRALRLRSPCAGQLLYSNVMPGMHITTTTLVGMIADTSQKVLEANVPENVQAKLTKGLPAEIQLCTSSLQNLSGELNSVFSSPEHADIIKVTISGDTSNIPVGTPAILKLALPQKNACLLLRRSAVMVRKDLTGAELPMVFIAEPVSKRHYRLKATPVVLGMSNLSYYEIIGGLMPEEVIVTGCNLGHSCLADGMVVTGQPCVDP